jgi:hypothetical protein
MGGERENNQNSTTAAERQAAVIGDFVTAKCWNPDQDDEAEKTIIRQGILAVQDPRTRHRAILGESGMVYMCVWNDAVEVVPDKNLFGHVLAAVEAWRKMYGEMS